MFLFRHVSFLLFAGQGERGALRIEAIETLEALSRD